MKNQNARKIFCLLASHAEVLRASSRLPCKRTFKGEGTPHEALGPSVWETLCSQNYEETGAMHGSVKQQ